MRAAHRFWAVWLAVGVAVEVWALRPGAGNRDTLSHAWRAFRGWAETHRWADLRWRGRVVSATGAATSIATTVFLVWAALHLPQHFGL